MTKYDISQTKNYGKQINYQELTDLLNGLILQNDYGILLDCIVPQIRNRNYPNGISKPIPFLKAVNLPERLMIIMVEYKLYIPNAENDQELSLELNKEKFRVFKKDQQITFIYNDKKVIKFRLHNSFDFSYSLDQRISIPKLPFISWVTSPFI